MIQLPPSPPLLKATQVAELMSASPTQVRRWIYDGQLEAIRLSPRVVRVPRAAVEAFIEKRAKAS